jgi:multidrug resistance efflux pump
MLSVAGILLGVWTVMQGSRPVPAAAPVSPPATAPFAHTVAGAGLVESSTENIAVGPAIAGTVRGVFVKVGQEVRAGDPLFRTDDRSYKAELAVRQGNLAAAQARLAASRAKLEKLKIAPRPEEIPPAEAKVAAAEAESAVARAKYDKLKAAPRPEEIPPSEAKVAAAAAALADLKDRLAMWEGVADKRAISQEEFARRRFAVQVAEAQLAQARKELDLLKAGTWKPDLAAAEADVKSADAKVAQAKADLTLLKAGTWKADLDVAEADVRTAEAEVAAAEAQVKAEETDLERLTVKAPVDCTILQVNVRLGEYAPTGITSNPLMLVGNTATLHVRVDVDENEAWRVRAGAPAKAFVRGNRDLSTELKFVRFEPFIVPKKSLTGDATERVDTRVLQVIYSFERGKLPVFVGQQMDVYIEALPPASNAPAPAPAAPTTPDKAKPAA